MQLGSFKENYEFLKFYPNVYWAKNLKSRSLCTHVPWPGLPPPAVEGRHALQDLLGVEAPELLGPDAVPEDAGEPQRHADLHGAEDYVVSVARGQVNPGKGGSEICRFH